MSLRLIWWLCVGKMMIIMESSGKNAQLILPSYEAVSWCLPTGPATRMIGSYKHSIGRYSPVPMSLNYSCLSMKKAEMGLEAQALVSAHSNWPLLIITQVASRSKFKYPGVTVNDHAVLHFCFVRSMLKLNECWTSDAWLIRWQTCITCLVVVVPSSAEC